MPSVQGTVYMNGELVAGPTAVTLVVWTVDGLRSWRGSFIALKPLMPGEIEVQMSDGRRGRAQISRTEVSASRATVVHFVGNGPLVGPGES